MPGGSLLVPHAPEGAKRTDDDDNEEIVKTHLIAFHYKENKVYY